MPEIDSWGRPVVREQRPIADGNDLDAVRHAILQVLRAKPQYWGKTASGVGVDEIRPQISGSFAYDAETEVIFYSALWSLVRDGIIVPGQPGRGYQASSVMGDLHNFKTFTVTPYGRRILENPEVIYPADAVAFIDDARARLGAADDVIYTYLAEAVKTFRDRSYLSATVMLGVSAETLMKWLIARFIDHLPPAKRPDFERTRSALWLKTEKLFRTFIGAFEHHYDELPRDLAVQADANLEQLQSLIRVNRDDVGHGRPQRADANLVEAHLLGYLSQLRLARELADAFANARPCTKYPS